MFCKNLSSVVPTLVESTCVRLAACMLMLLPYHTSEGPVDLGFQEVTVLEESVQEELGVVRRWPVAPVRQERLHCSLSLTAKTAKRFFDLSDVCQWVCCI